MAEGKPKVSVCITTYNLEKFIEKTLDSILHQETPFPFEIIIHDDASTDQTVNKIKRYSEKYPDLVKTVFQPKNLYRSHPGGLGHIFNTHILPLTEGEYIAICDGDDYWTDNRKLEKQVRYLENNQEFIGCFTNVKTLNEMSGKESIFNKNIVEGAVDDKEIILNGGSIYSASTILFRKEDFIRSPFHKRYEEFARHHEYDTLFIYCLIMGGEVAFLNEITAIYRRWSQGLYSGILNNSSAIAAIKERELYGNKKLIEIAAPRQKKFLKRKISLDALYILQNRKGFKKYRYLFDLSGKEMLKWLIGRQH